MDRPLSREYKKKITVKQAAEIAGVVILLILVVLFLKKVFIPGVSISKVTTATVNYGNIDITAQGSGTVIPAYEEIISAPFSCFNFK